jgi:peptide deformylase
MLVSNCLTGLSHNLTPLNLFFGSLTTLLFKQIGYPVQAFCFEVDNNMLLSEVRDLTLLGMVATPLTIVINPKIKLLGTQCAVHREGCLSVPNYSAHVKRHMAVEVSGLDHTGAEWSMRAFAYTARILQHEMDHLAGCLYVDRMEPTSFCFEPEGCKHPPDAFDVKFDGR